MKLHPLIRQELEASPGKWEIEECRKGIKLRIDGRLVGVIGNNLTITHRALLNVRAQIRRFNKELHAKGR